MNLGPVKCLDWRGSLISGVNLYYSGLPNLGHHWPWYTGEVSGRGSGFPNLGPVIGGLAVDLYYSGLPNLGHHWP